MLKITISKDDLKEIKLKKRKEKDKKIYRRLQFLHLKHKNKTNKEIADILGVCVDTITDWARIYSNEGVSTGRQLLRIGKALGLLENSVQRSVTLTELTELTAMSVSTLNRTFKEATGFSPIDYHLRIRIKKAGEILCSSNFSVTEIASRTGFDDSNYFWRQCKKIMGVSPLEFRKRCL